MRAMEERYKRYMDKACTVSKVFVLALLHMNTINTVFIKSRGLAGFISIAKARYISVKIY